MKFRKSTNKNPLLYGFHAVREAWLNETRLIQTLYLTPQAQKGFEDTILEGRAKGLRRTEPVIIEKQKLERMLPRDAVHQGVALQCNPLEEMDVRDLVIRMLNKPRAVLAILDQVTDPHNVGAILRSASAFGLDGVIMQKKHAPALDGVLAKTACGALEHIPIAQATNLSRAIEELKEAGYHVMGLDERGRERLGDAPSPDKLALVLGSEGDGIRHLVKESCDSLICLPTQGAIASLNVSNAAAVAFYAVMKKDK